MELNHDTFELVETKEIRCTPVMIGSRILTRPLKPKGRTRSGIYVVGKDNPQEGTEAEVIAIGPGILLQDGSRHAMQTRVGDRVLIGPRTVKVMIDEVDCFVVDEGDILAVLR